MAQKSIVPNKIVSGGQTGVDRAALDAAIALGIEHGGWCPRDRLAEDGTIPAVYKLCETASGNYARRTQQNVLDSDGTLIFYHGTLGGGTLLTANLANRRNRPLLKVDLDEFPAEDVDRIRGGVLQWLQANHVATLNVAGPRESQLPGIQQEVFELLTRMFGE
ncbi:MAG: putative molybdenum carrier protein [Planctomycetota bacterium]|nr:putative molybdenum carrier protein [Planctomycetota bacterium]